MGQSEISMWTVDSIQCSSWKEASDRANVQISNFAGDLIAFEVVRTPNGDTIPLNTISDFRSRDWYLHTNEVDAIGSLIPKIEKDLDDWQAKVHEAAGWLTPDKWRLRRGQAADEALWAALAYLFELRAEMFEAKIIEALAKDMKVDVSLAKERIRKTRDKGFLGIAGKGNSAEGRMTKDAKHILLERGMLNAKKGK